MFNKLFKRKYLQYCIILTILIMGIFFFNFNKSKVNQLPPERFSFMSQKEQIEFQKDLSEYLKSSYPEFKINFSKGVVYGSDKTEYGLDNLAQSYHIEPFKTRKDIIKNHFEGVINSGKEREELTKKIKDFNSVKEYISVRIYSQDYIDQMKNGLIYREDIPEVKSVLVFDLPSIAINIKPEEAKIWGISESELFELGINNSITKYKVEISKNRVDDDISVWLLASDSIFTANNALSLEKNNELIGKYGSLIILPNRHAVIVYPIEDINVIKAVNKIAFLAKMMYEEGPGSLTSNLYWYRKGKFINLPYKIENKKLDFFPPEEFLELLNGLAEKK